jgi:hypothetical protein
MPRPWFVLAALVGCASGDPPTRATPAEPSEVPATTAVATQPAAQPSEVPSAMASASAEPPLLDADGKLLPQTDDEPRADSPLYLERVALLFRAIVEDDPEIARPFFFPLPAYQAVKAIEDPARDWQNRLWKLFARDVHHYHQEVGRSSRGPSARSG